MCGTGLYLKINVFMNGLNYNVCFCSEIQSRKFCAWYKYYSIYKHNLLCSFIVTLGVVWMKSVTVSRVNTQGLAYCCMQKLLQYSPCGNGTMGDFQRLCIPRLSRGYCFWKWKPWPTSESWSHFSRSQSTFLSVIDINDKVKVSDSWHSSCFIKLPFHFQ